MNSGKADLKIDQSVQIESLRCNLLHIATYWSKSKIYMLAGTFQEMQCHTDLEYGQMCFRPVIRHCHIIVITYQIFEGIKSYLHIN